MLVLAYYNISITYYTENKGKDKKKITINKYIKVKKGDKVR